MKFVLVWLVIMIVNSGGVSVVQGKTIVVGPSEGIQAAIAAADPGDIIEVSSGTYRENVDANKQVLLFGVDTGAGRAGGGRWGEGKRHHPERPRDRPGGVCGDKLRERYR